MSALAEATAVAISCEVACTQRCVELSFPLHKQLSSGRYDVCSVLPMLNSLEDWRSEHRTARKRADRAERLGYHFNEIRRHEHADDIYAINTSLAERQGRPMSAGYQQRPSASPDPVYTCARHAVHTYGVLDVRGTLVAYLWLYRCGELALVSSILGHGHHLRYEVMYLLFQGMLERQIAQGGFVVYNRHDSGTDGLRFFKERCGFAPMEVSWTL